MPHTIENKWWDLWEVGASLEGASGSKSLEAGFALTLPVQAFLPPGCCVNELFHSAMLPHDEQAPLKLSAEINPACSGFSLSTL